MLGIEGVKTVDELIEKTMLQLDKNRIRWAVVSGDDDVIDTWVKRYPNRLIPAYLPDIRNPNFKELDHQAEANRLAKRIASKEIRVMGELSLAYEKIPLNDRTLWPYYRVAEGRIPVFFHTGPGPRGNHTELTKPSMLREIADAFPNLVIVACHVGDGSPEFFQLLKRHPNIYSDITVANWGSPEDCAMVLKMFKSADLLDRVLYGSDQMIFPELISRSAMNVAKAGLTPDELEAVFWKNAARIIELPKNQKLDTPQSP